MSNHTRWENMIGGMRCCYSEKKINIVTRGDRSDGRGNKGLRSEYRRPGRGSRRARPGNRSSRRVN